SGLLGKSIAMACRGALRGYRSFSIRSPAAQQGHDRECGPPGLAVVEQVEVPPRAVRLLVGEDERAQLLAIVALVGHRLDQLRRVVMAEIVVIARGEVPRLVGHRALAADLDEPVIADEPLEAFADLLVADLRVVPEPERVIARLGPAEAPAGAVGEVMRDVAEIAPVEKAAVGVLHLPEPGEGARDQRLGNGDAGLPRLEERDEARRGAE